MTKQEIDVADKSVYGCLINLETGLAGTDEVTKLAYDYAS